MGAALKCTIKEFDFASECQDGGMPLITMGVVDSPQVSSCAAAALDAFDPEPTTYGDDVRIRFFSCSVERTGLTCTNSAGNGFQLSRAALRLF